MAYISFQPSDYFNTLTYSGTGGNGTTTEQAITGAGFQPDLVWLKQRSSTQQHQICDSIRGANNLIATNSTNAQVADTQIINSFDSDGFTAGYQDQANDIGHTYVSWLWKANGSGSANTDGSINTTYTSANTTSGFSISTYTGTGSVGTIGHGLGSVPKMIIVKRLDSASSWSVYHSALGNANQLNLNGTDASTSSSGWNSTNPTSSVFSIGSTGSYNGSGNTYVAYCFAEKKGFSKFGSYTGNGNADGTFVYTGFKPAFVMVKKSSASGDNWSILDNKRNTFNVMNKYLDPNSSNAEGTADIWDFTSQGFKMRNTFSGYNASGATFIYMAFSEHPLVSSNDIPATAR